jgi:hypothetical protein
MSAEYAPLTPRERSLVDALAEVTAERDKLRADLAQIAALDAENARLAEEMAYPDPCPLCKGSGLAPA